MNTSIMILVATIFYNIVILILQFHGRQICCQKTWDYRSISVCVSSHLGKSVDSYLSWTINHNGKITGTLCGEKLSFFHSFIESIFIRVIVLKIFYMYFIRRLLKNNWFYVKNINIRHCREADFIQILSETFIQLQWFRYHWYLNVYTVNMLGQTRGMERGRSLIQYRS